MESTIIGLVYFFAGSFILFATGKLMKKEFKLWAIIITCSVAGILAIVVPHKGAGVLSLVSMVAVLKFTTNESWEEVIVPVLVARLALIPVLMLVGTW